ncbi:AbgT family transporter [Clostridium swellfunianum]|uniref:AbgT family transporter n=1 Tax=Clostridium swellfunianum TaxID=1367462 RepID=UPI002549AE32|nr:AbgT family transporter [Clostridium swellfunianum]
MINKVQKQKTEKKGLFARFLDVVEKVGNKMPHPVTIFLILCAAIVIISHILATAGVSVTYTGFDSKTQKMGEITVKAISLLTPDGVRYMFTDAVKNFTGFAPLGTVLVALLGVGVAEGTGLISALIRKLVLGTPKRLITAVVVFAGVMSNIASDAGYVVLIPLGAVIFLGFKRHPLAGVAAAFAGVSGGFSANLFPGPTDALLGGITTEAAKMLDPKYSVGATDNWYFLAVSTVLITILGTYVVEKIVEPRLGEYKGNASVTLEKLTDSEKKGLKYALIGFILTAAAMVALVAPYNGLLRDPKTHKVLESPFMTSIVVVIALAFLIPGIFYGIGSGTAKTDKAIVAQASKAMASMGSYIVLVFVAAQFVAYFNYSKLGTILAVSGADFLKGAGIKGIPLMIGFVIVTALINLFMASASAKWAIMAPIFVPMLMQMGFAPEFTQVAFRIGDSTTNIITPLMSYFAMIVALSEKYDKDAGIGTLISTMVPFSIVFLVGWTILLVVWYVLGLPIGPGAGIFM